MFIDFLLEAFEANQDKTALVWNDQEFPYSALATATRRWLERLVAEQVPRGSIVALEADFSPQAVALMLALIEHACVVVPLTDTLGAAKRIEFKGVAEVEWTIRLNADDEASVEKVPGATVTHEFLHRLKACGHPGLVLFSSGSTGKSKAALHDFVPLLEKFKARRHALRMMSFLLFDHIGGVNTMLYALSNGGCLVTVRERTPAAVCDAIDKFGVELLPTSPTFINLLLLAEVDKSHSLASLKTVTYGTEVMPAYTLRRFREVFPHIALVQTYGLSEVGILRSKSQSSDSLFVKVGGEGFETRVVDGLLEIKAKSAMLGYLNAPSPFTDDGWFKTGDAVIQNGDYIQFLGRRSEIINVGGEKVYPAEVESVIQQMEGVEDVAVRGEPNPITGHIVTARVKLANSEPLSEFRKRMRAFCQGKLEPFKVPQKVTLVDEASHGERFKKMR